MRILVIIGVALLVQFVWWFANPAHIGYAPLFWLLTLSLGYKLLRMLHEWYHYLHVQEPVLPVTPSVVRQRTVDMLTTACPGEPHDMIVRTLEALVAVRYPHTSYLCDEGDDPYLRATCARLGVVHVTRTEKKHAKAGNINNALRQATGELCVVLDPDHAPTPDFLDQVIGYFDDPQVGYVQVVQAYGNQQESLIARGAAEQTYHFYGPLMMSMNTYNTVQAIGANCTFRRAALDSIGGHAAGLTEDMHTAMRLHAAGWKSIYAPVIVSRGLVPSSLAAFYSQQLKWSRGAFDLLLTVYPRLFKQFTWRQRLHYLTMPLYFFSGMIALLDLVVPIAALWLHQFPWHLSLPEFILHLLPVVSIALLIRCYAQRWLREPHERGLHLAGGVLRLSTWWVYALGLVYTVLQVKVPYIPTPKEGQVQNEWRLCLPNLVLALGAVLVTVASLQVPGLRGPYTKLMIGLALGNAAMLVLATLMAQQVLLSRVRAFLRTTRTAAIVKKHLTNRIVASAGTLTRSLRTGAVAVAVAVALVVVHTLGSIGVLLVQQYKQASLSAASIWAHTGTGGLRTGQLQPKSLGKWPVAATANQATVIQGRDAAAVGHLVDVTLPAEGTRQLPAALLKKINQQGNLPLVTWTVTDTSRGNPIFQQIHWFGQHNQPVLLRPLLRASTPHSYRAAWQAMVKSCRATGDTTAIWVWTPPRPDSIAAYFPGSAYVTWIVGDCRPTSARQRAWTSRYAAFRRQAALQVAMQSKPILLIMPPSPSAPPADVTDRYPEVKAILWAPNRSLADANKGVDNSFSSEFAVENRAAAMP